MADNSVNVETVTLPVEKHVAVIVRMFEALNSLTFIVHDAKTNKWCLPGGPIGSHGTEEYARAELRKMRTQNLLLRQCGLELPAPNSLKELKTVKHIKNNTVCETTVFLADVSIEYFNCADSNYRDKADAIQMAANLQKIISVAAKKKKNGDAVEDIDPKHGFTQCLARGVDIAEYFDFDSRKDYTSFSFGRLVTIRELKDVVECDAIDNLELAGFPMMYTMEEYPVWEVALSMLDDSRPAEDICKAGQKTGRETAGLPADLMRQLPKFSTISSKEPSKLKHQLVAVKDRLVLQKADLESQDTISFVVTLFDEKLLKWWNGQGKGLKLQSVPDLIKAIRNYFSIKDYEGDSLINLLDLKETEGINSIGEYTEKFNEYYADWEEAMNFKLAAYLYIRGLANENIRSDLMMKVKDNKAVEDCTPAASHGDQFRELQACAAATSLARKDIAQSTKAFSRMNMNHNQDRNGKNKRKEPEHSNKNNGGSGSYNNKFKGRNKDKFKKPSQRSDRSDRPANSPAFEAAKAKLTKDQLKDAFNKGKCIKCLKTGHLFENCPN